MQIAFSISMKKETDYITSLVVNWKINGSGYSEIMKESARIIMEYPAKRFNWDYDRCVDFYLAFFPKLSGLVGSFEYRGIPFEALLRNTLKWQSCSYYNRHIKKKKLDGCIKNHCMIEAEAAAEKNVEYLPSENLTSDRKIISEQASKLLKTDSSGKLKRKGLRKQMIMLALKNAFFIDDEYIKKISGLTGCSHEWLVESVKILKEKNINQKERYESYSNRLSKAYVDICRIHSEIKNSSSLIEKNRLEKERNYYMQRMTRAREAKGKVTINPSNSEISELMGLPKGSVDSGLYFLKKTLKDLC